MRQIEWTGSSLKALIDMPQEIRAEMGHGLYLAQTGQRLPRSVAHASAGTGDMTIEHHTSGGNVFADLELPDAEERIIKSRFAAVLQRGIGEMKLTQTAAATLPGISQPRLSRMFRGRFDAVSEACLAEGLRRPGHDVEMHVKPRHEGVGSTCVMEYA